jgi:hypothetical protein
MNETDKYQVELAGQNQLAHVAQDQISRQPTRRQLAFQDIQQTRGEVDTRQRHAGLQQRD